MSETSGDQIHPATPARLEQARRDGDFAKSYELAGSIQLIGGLLVLFLLGGGVATWLMDWTRNTWTHATTADGQGLVDGSVEQLQSLSHSFGGVLAPLLILFFLICVLSHWIQTGPFFSANLAMPQADRLSPVGWFKRLISFKSFAHPFIGFPKTIVCLAVGVLIFWTSREQVFQLSTSSFEQMAQDLFGLVLKVCLGVAVTLFTFSLADYAIQRFSFSRKMRMTDQQLRDEMRMQNGDPQIQSRQRQAHQEFTRRV